MYGAHGQLTRRRFEVAEVYFPFSKLPLAIHFLFLPFERTNFEKERGRMYGKCGDPVIMDASWHHLFVDRTSRKWYCASCPRIVEHNPAPLWFGLYTEQS